MNTGIVCLNCGYQRISIEQCSNKMCYGPQCIGEIGTLRARVKELEHHLDRVLSLAENSMGCEWTQFNDARKALEDGK